MQLYQTHNKQTTITLSLKTNRKHLVAMFKNNNPLFFINFVLFSTCSFLLQLLCFAENTIQIMLSEEHSFSKTQLVKPTFSPMPKNTCFKKGVIFGFGQFPLKPLFCYFSWFSLFWSKNIFGSKQIVCTKMRFFSLPDTNSVRQFLLKIHFSDFSHFWITTLKTQFL